MGKIAPLSSVEKPALAGKILTVPLGYALADELAKKLLLEYQDKPLELSSVMIILPTKRAVRAVKEAFIRESAGRTFLLPKMIAVASPEESAVFLEDDILPAVSALEAKTILMAEIMKNYAHYGIDTPTPDKAAALAEALLDFWDEAQKEEVDFAKMEKLAPLDFASHWQKVLGFLKLVIRDYPELLKARGKIGAGERMVRLLRQKIKAWREKPFTFPVIAAGITGSLPVVAELLKTVAENENGLVLLPFLDKEMGEKEWQAVGDTHPQFQMKKLLVKMGVTREEVGYFVPPKQQGRFTFISEVMRPFETTDDWREVRGKLVADDLCGIYKIEAETEAEEAVSVALILREALEEKGQRAMLVTPSRELAKRVAVQMRRWGVSLDDSAGQNLNDTKVGVFLNLLAAVAAAGEQEEFSARLALYKHPLAAAGKAPVDFKLRVRKWEKARRQEVIAESSGQDTFYLELEKMGVDFAPFIGLFEHSDKASFVKVLEEHIKVAEALAASDERTGAERLWQGEAGEIAARTLAELKEYAEVLGEIDAAYYPALFRNFLGSYAVRPRYGMHPRLDILGPIEARLQTADIIVVAGLNEGVFPPADKADPWLSRQMRQALGLASYDEDIGMAAHDFVSLFSSKKIYLTRAGKEDGAPSVPSRWLLRMGAVLEAAGLSLPVDKDNILGVAKGLDLPRADEIKSVPQPKVYPPREVRPKKLSVTEISTLMRDPYAVYAKHILKLYALDPIDYQVGKKEYGTAVHNALADFARKFGTRLPADSYEELCKLGRFHFAKVKITGAAFAFWWSMFERVAKWFVDEQEERLVNVAKTVVEQRGEIKFPIASGEFTLTGIADRIDVLDNGKVVIVDYKTGGKVKPNEVISGYAPQLTLEAAMLDRGAFAEAGVPAGAEVVALEYWKISGRASGSYTYNPLKKCEDDINTVVDGAYQGLVNLVEKFDNAAMPYVATPRMKYVLPFSDYEYLERLKEWAVKDDEDENDGE